MQTQFDLKSLEAERLSLARPYFEFLRVPAMSAGIYLLPAGGTDKQKPHGQDEIYYVIRGRAGLTIQDGTGQRILSVKAGDVIFVEALREHRFHSIEEELLLLVFFAPAESEA